MQDEIIKRIQEDLNYDPETGSLTWGVSRPKAKAGKECGCLDKDGYRVMTFHGKQFMVHRVIWAHQHGAFPEEELDHVNRVRDDNRLSNLREATHSQNSHNTSKRRHNTSGILGVTKSGKRWQACVVLLRKRHIQRFDCVKEAETWVKEKRQELHGEFSAAG